MLTIAGGIILAVLGLCALYGVFWLICFVIVALKE
jgi:hypothetical protein